MLELILNNLKQKHFFISKSIFEPNLFLVQINETFFKIYYLEINSKEYLKSHDYTDVDYVVMFFLDKNIICWFNSKTKKMSSDIGSTNHDDFKFLFHRVKVERPSKEYLHKLLWSEPTTSIAKKYGVSDKAVERWSKNYGLNKPPVGYWNKVKHGKI